MDYVFSDMREYLADLGKDEVLRYMKEFPNEPDYNLAAYGNMRIYYHEIREMYRKAGYAESTLKLMNDDKLWRNYRSNVGYLARMSMHIEHFYE